MPKPIPGQAPFAVAIVLLATSIPAMPSDAPEPTVDGVYYCEGQTAAGGTYQGLVVIRTVDGSLRIEWLLPGLPALTGVGVRRGAMLAVTIERPVPGIALYEIEDGTLSGTVTMYGPRGGLSFETLVRVPADDVHPRSGDDVRAGGLPSPIQPVVG